MKNLLLIVALVIAGAMKLNAKTSIHIPTVEEAQTNGWEALWGSYDYGYVMPENYTFVDNDEIKLYLNKAANVATGVQCKNDFSIALQMGSSMERESNEAVYMLEALYNGMKQPYAVLTLEPKVSGKISLCYSRGKNSTTLYVFDTTAKDGLGAYVMANSVLFDDVDGAVMPHTSVVNVIKGHKYYIFGAETGANIDFYGMDFISYSDPEYATTTTENAAGSTMISIPTVEEAQTNGWEALWGSYDYGYVMPENYTFVDNDEIKLYLNKAANVATGVQCKNDFSIALQMGSSMERESNEAVYMLEALYNGMKQPYAVLTLEPKVSGKISLCYSRGKNSTTLYVFDTTAKDGLGAYVMANSVLFDDVDGAVMPHSSVVNVTKGHKYYIFGAETGANIDFYSFGFTSYSDSNYGGTTGIENVVTGNDATVNDGKIYTIDGRYIGKDKENLGKGLYIMNGKKFVVK